MPFGGLLTAGIIAGASAYSAHKTASAEKKAREDQANLYNDWQRQYQNTGQNLLAQAQGAGFNPFGPRVSTTQGGTTSQGGGSFSNRPVITGQYAPLDALMRGIMTNRLAGGSSLPPGYASTGIQAINQSFEGADQAARNLAARKGLSGEQTYAVASPANRARAGQIASFRANLPLLEREMQNQDIGITSGLQSAFGTGQAGTSSQFGTSQNFGQTTMPFSTGDLSALMSILMPPGPQQTTQTGISPAANTVDSLAAMLGFLASQRGGSTPYMSSRYGAAGAPPSPYGYG